jgi:cell division protein ZapB
LQQAYNGRQMAVQTYIDQISDRLERLLLRHEELQRTNALLTQQVRTLTQERDQFKAQQMAARQRLDALIAQLPNDLGDTAA